MKRTSIKLLSLVLALAMLVGVFSSTILAVNAASTAPSYGEDNFASKLVKQGGTLTFSAAVSVGDDVVYSIDDNDLRSGIATVNATTGEVTYVANKAYEDLASFEVVATNDQGEDRMYVDVEVYSFDSTIYVDGDMKDPIVIDLKERFGADAVITVEDYPADLVACTLEDGVLTITNTGKAEKGTYIDLMVEVDGDTYYPSVAVYFYDDSYTRDFGDMDINTSYSWDFYAPKNPADATYEVTAAPENGKVTIEDGIITYTPNKDFAGEDAFTVVRTIADETLTIDFEVIVYDMAKIAGLVDKTLDLIKTMPTLKDDFNNPDWDLDTALAKVEENKADIQKILAVLSQMYRLRDGLNDVELSMFGWALEDAIYMDDELAALYTNDMTAIMAYYIAYEDNLVDGVMLLIDGLPKPDKVVLSDAILIDGLRAWYEKLSADQKPLVLNYYKLEACEARLAELKAEAKKTADREAAKKVEDMINALPAVDKVKLSDAPAIAAARAAFNALTNDQKALVNPDLLAKLTALEKAIQDLSSGNGTATTGTGTNGKNINSPKTGEFSDITLIYCFAGLTCITLIFLLIPKKKKTNE